MKVVLSIAGSDSSGGAGIQADLKTMCAHGVFGMSAITAMTAQNTMGVTSIMESTPDFLAAQIDACLSDIPADAVKIGMLPSTELLDVVVEKVKEYNVKNLVVDPVMVSTSGSKLMKDSVGDRMSKMLFPLCKVITPNIPETQALTGMDISNEDDMEQAAKLLNKQYGCAALVNGGHSIADANDVLCMGEKLIRFRGKRIDNPNTHGTGCTLSSAIASNLALGYDLVDAASFSKEYLTRAIAANLDLGKGHGPLNHMV